MAEVSWKCHSLVNDPGYAELREGWRNIFNESTSNQLQISLVGEELISFA